MGRQLRIGAVVLSAGLSLLLNACYSCSRRPAGGEVAGGAASTAAPAGFYTPPGAVFQATYTKNTVRLDLPTVRKTLRSVSRDARVFLFDDSDSRIAQLTKGKVMFLEHLGARRIVNAQKQGGQIALLTEPAALTDFIEDGRIEFKAPINFRRVRAQNAASPENGGFLGGLQG